MNNRGGRMKRDKIRMVIIYILILVIIVLVAFLMYIVLTSGKKENKVDTNEPVKKNEIAEECKFDVDLSNYNTIINNPASENLCSGDNELNITGVMVGGKEQNLKVEFYNGEGEDGAVYLDDKKIVNGASLSVQNGLGVFDDKLFIFTHTANDLNVYAYDGNGMQLYNLETALASAQVTDPALSELAKTNANINTIVNTTNIDSSTMKFAENEFTFSTKSGMECVSGNYSGSAYKVTFTGATFNAPEFVTTNMCP